MTTASRTDALHLKDETSPERIQEYSGLPDAPAPRRGLQDCVDLLPLLMTPGLMSWCVRRLGDPAAEKIMCYRAVLRAGMTVREGLDTTAAEAPYRSTLQTG